MDIELKPFRSKDAPGWESFVQNSNNGTLFHERRFLGYHTKGRFKDHSLMAYKKGKLLAVFPAANVQRDEESWLISHPGSSYGGFVYPEDISIRDALDLGDALVKNSAASGFGGIQITLPPAIYQHRVSNYLDFALLKHGFDYAKRDVSSLLNIEADPELNLARFKPTHRTAVRRAIKQNVTIKESDRYAEFYEILKENLKIRHGVQPTHTLDELMLLKKLYPARIKLFGAFHDNELIAGVVTFDTNRQVLLAFYISHRESHQHLRGVNLLFFEIIKWCHRQKYRYLDFGIFTVNMDPNFGLGRFKENFGASGVFRDTFTRKL